MKPTDPTPLFLNVNGVPSNDHPVGGDFFFCQNLAGVWLWCMDLRI